jgi:diadenosine tetraphosphate (Ap4A) HIT family hydrolase
MTTQEDCLMCQHPLFTDRGFSQFQKIADLDVSTAILNRDWQFYKGSTLLVFQSHVTELHHLTPNLQHRFMADACRMAETLVKTFQPLKINDICLEMPCPISTGI